MPFAELYAEVQTRDIPISTRWLKERAIRHSTITTVKEQWSGLINSSIIRGWYEEGPQAPPIPLAEHQSLIVLSREMCKGHQGDYWRRFIYTKELMHVFDEDEEKAHDEKTFDIQIERFGDPSADVSPQFRAESKAYWRALAVLCPEKERLEFKQKIVAKEMSLDVVGARLRIPANVVRDMMRDDFAQIVASIRK